jgi:hypothetical protein
MANNDIYANLWGLIQYGSQQEADPTKQGTYKTIQDYLKGVWGKENPNIEAQLGVLATDPSKITDWGSLYDLAKNFSDNPEIYDNLMRILDQYAPANMRSTAATIISPDTGYGLAITEAGKLGKTPEELTTGGYTFDPQTGKWIKPGEVAGGEVTTEGKEETTVVTPPTTPPATINPFAGTSLEALGAGLMIEFPGITKEEVDYYTKLVTETTSADIESQKVAIQYMIDLYEKYKGEVTMTPEEILKQAQAMGAINYDTIIQTLDDNYKTKMTQLQNQKGEINAVYAGVYERIQQGIRASRARTKEDLNSRGLMFSGLLSRALAGVEEEGLKLIGENAAQQAAKLISIANDIAVLTSNYTADELKQNTLKAAYVGLQYMSIMTDDKKEKQTIDLILVQLQGQLKGLDITKESTIREAVRVAVAGAEAGKISNWKDFMTISISYLGTVASILSDQRAADLSDKIFDQSKDEAERRYELDYFIAHEGSWQDKEASELGWAQLDETERSNKVDEAIRLRQAKLAEAQAALENNPQDPTQMSAADIASIMTKLAPTYVTIYERDKNGNVKIDENTKQPIVEKQIMIFADEDYNQETGEIIMSPGGLRDTYNIYKTALAGKSKDLLNFTAMSPLKFWEYLTDPLRKTEGMKDWESFPSIEEQTAYYIVSQYGFDLSDKTLILADLDDMTKKDVNKEVDWMVVYEMIFGVFGGGYRD